MSSAPPIAPLQDPRDWDNIVNLVSLPVYVADAETLTLVAVNQAMGTGAAIGQPCYSTVYGLGSPCPSCPLAAKPGLTPEVHANVREYHDIHDKRWLQLHERLMTWFDNRLVLHSVAVDITQLKEVQTRLDQACAEINKISIIDPLTGVSNRRKLEQVLDYEVQRATRYEDNLSFILAEIDRFEDVADIFGHQAGDLVLGEFAKILAGQTRKIDTVGRWNDYRFLVICPDTSLAGARALAEKLRGVVKDHVFPSIGARTASFGVVQFAKPDESAEVVARLEQVLAQAQNDGRNRVVAFEA